MNEKLTLPDDSPQTVILTTLPLPQPALSAAALSASSSSTSPSPSTAITTAAIAAATATATAAAQQPTFIVNAEDYRYEPPYVVDIVKANAEITSTLYCYTTTNTASAAAAAEVGVVGAASMAGIKESSSIGSIGNDFVVSTIKSSNKSSRNHSPNSKQQQQQQQQQMQDADSKYCACFGHSKKKKTPSHKGVAGCGSNKQQKQQQQQQQQTQIGFWSALFANLGICTLLLGYIFVGSFIFLTIENSGIKTTTAKTMTTWNYAHVPQQQHRTEKEINAISSQQHNDNIHTNIETKTNIKSQQIPNVAENEVRGGVGAGAATMQADMLMHSMHDRLTDGGGGGMAVSLAEHNANVDFQVKNVNPDSGNVGVSDDAATEDEDDVDADNEVEDEQLRDVDGERQRTVENIWDITVSLNILYKENWTKLAALEIARYQDQLVKRLVMDLTLSTAATATKPALTASRGHNTLQYDGSSGSSSSTRQSSSQNAKHFNGGAHQHQQQQQQHEGYQHQHNTWRQQYKRYGYYHHQQQQQQFEWNFATSFLYSLTVITTVGYGTITPRTTLGRIVTIAYATIGIPLMLIYLSSIGGALAKLVRVMCTHSTVCCCFCRRRQQRTYCGFRLQQVSDKKCNLKLKQLQQHQLQQHQQQQHLPYCYVRPPADINGDGTTGGGGLTQHHNMFNSSLDTLSVATTATESRHSSAHANAISWSLVLPVALCVLLMLAYIVVGSVVIALLEHWSLIDGIYFCFMSLTTIGFCDLLPGMQRVTASQQQHAPHSASSTSASTYFTVWFCAVYILSGLTLTSMCVNLLHEEILMRMRVVVKFKKVSAREKKEHNIFGGGPPP